MTPLVERVMAKVEKTETCWLWRGFVGDNGYGCLKVSGPRVAEGKREGKTYPAHRLVYELLVGPIPEGLQLDHLCRVTNCVNPAHLEPVTQSVNIRRANAARAALRGDRCVNGHPRTPENLIPRSDVPGSFRCRLCDREKSARNRRKTSTAAAANNGG